MPTVFSANSSSILLDCTAIEGLQSITFRVTTEREDIRAVGTHERIDVSFGLRGTDWVEVRSGLADGDLVLLPEPGAAAPPAGRTIKRRLP